MEEVCEIEKLPSRIEIENPYVPASTNEICQAMQSLEPNRGFSAEQALVLTFMRGCEHRGSDVRVDAGVLCRPNVWPRHAIDPRLWDWGLALMFPFRHPGHITELELRTGLAMLQWRLRSECNVGTVYFHLYDSAVCIAVNTKHRSSSKRLNNVLRRISTLELAGAMHGLFGYVRSEMNPADGPSRKKHKTCHATTG